MREKWKSIEMEADIKNSLETAFLRLSRKS